MREKHKIFGLIGKNISYSFSPDYFNNKFKEENIDAEYRLFDIDEINKVKGVFNQSVGGLNVTIPYKEEIIPFLDRISGAAKEINAVNTIQFKDYEIIGHNTDVIGFKNSIQPLLKPHHKKALILGTGGASKAVKYVFKELNIDFKVVSRSDKADFTYESLNKEILSEYLIIVNCTPLGTFPNVEKTPDIPFDAITEKHLVYDLIYNPEKTTFLRKAENKGATIKNGLEMLQGQAEAAWDIWNS